MPTKMHHNSFNIRPCSSYTGKENKAATTQYSRLSDMEMHWKIGNGMEKNGQKIVKMNLQKPVVGVTAKLLWLSEFFKIKFQKSEWSGNTN